MIYIALKLQEIKKDIALLYNLPLSFYFDYINEHQSSFAYIQKEFRILAAHFAPILS